MTGHEAREKAAMIAFDYLRIRAEHGADSQKLVDYWDLQVTAGDKVRKNGYPDNQNPYRIAINLLIAAGLE